jgi:hypothetical protein
MENGRIQGRFTKVLFSKGTLKMCHFYIFITFLAHPLQRGDNHKNIKMGWAHLKIFSRSTEPEELIFTFKLSDII